jgi:hypothetical protein
MPPHPWAEGAGLDAAHGLLGWAKLAVDGLHWLSDVDDHAFKGDRRDLNGHGEVAVDMAHSRWASITAKTAVDLCAAELSVRHANVDLWADRLPTIEKLDHRHRARLPRAAREWVAGILTGSRLRDR